MMPSGTVTDQPHHEPQCPAGDSRWDGHRLWERSKNAVSIQCPAVPPNASTPNAIIDAKSDQRPPHAAILATVTHELRSPLTAIRGALGLICSGTLGTLPEPMARMLAIASTNSDRMLSLIDDILLSDVLAAGRLPMRWEAVELAELMREVIGANTGLLNARTGYFVLESAPPGKFARADHRRLLQVLTNLLSNAVKFAPAGTPIALSLQQIGTRHRITVRDEGPGIPESFRPHIFQRFARASETANEIPGNGLGLSIAQAIIVQHGGTIWFESPDGGATPGRGGTRFHIDLPRLDDAPPSSEIHSL